jgi:hypothetical protein
MGYFFRLRLKGEIMSEPMGLNARSEIVSAMSSLNMEVSEYTGPTRNEDGSVIYLSAVNNDAAHSMEHLDSAEEVLRSIRVNDLFKLRKVVNGIVAEMGGWDLLPFERWEEFDDVVREIEAKI